jgi:hypothetical protein
MLVHVETGHGLKILLLLLLLLLLTAIGFPLNELKIIGIHEIRNTYKQNWFEHNQPTQNGRILKQYFKYHPRGKRDPVRPRSRWKLQAAGTGPNGRRKKKVIREGCVEGSGRGLFHECHIVPLLHVVTEQNHEKQSG